jgi:plasmid maintenance system antidote protein VapI
MSVLLDNPLLLGSDVFDVLIEKSGLKKKYLAKKIGIVPNHLYQFLAGNRNLSDKKRLQLYLLLKTVNQ